MIEVINDTKRYWNQYKDVTDIFSTKKDERTRTCNITCVSMITGDHPDAILHEFWEKYGQNDKFQWESLLIKYLEDNGYPCKKMTEHAYPKARQIRDHELIDMMGELVKGKVIFYHKKGHYQLMVGYRIIDQVPEYIFNDPAGDRTKMRWQRKKGSGHLVTYSHQKVKREKIYGSCYSVTI